MNVLFAGTPDFAVAPLLKLIEAHTVVGVFTQPDRKSGRGKKLTPPPVKVTAIQHELPVFQPHSLKDQGDLIRGLNADVMVVVAYGMLLSEDILSIPPNGCINIHASLLPRWRGAAPIQRAIEAGDKESGVSIMKMELGLDTGPVYHTLSTKIEQHDTSASLHEKLAALGAQGIIDTLAQIEQNPNIEPVIQDDSKANYAKKITKQEADINWSDSASQIEQRIRAFNPWPICQTKHQNMRLRIWQASVIPTIDGKHQTGEVIETTPSGVIVACGQGALRLQKLQKDGGKPLPSEQFLNGYEISTGDVLS